jgi:hypothetical protein
MMPVSGGDSVGSAAGRDPEAFSPSAEDANLLGSEREDHFVVGAFENGLLGGLASIARRG